MAVCENSVTSEHVTTRIRPDEVTFHPVADIFPPMSDAEFRELVEDIREHGQREAVWMLEDGQVIDGRHRVKACAELGRSVDARVYHGEGEAITSFVVSLNLKRRHLNESQRDMVAARLANLKQGDNRFTIDSPIGASISQCEAAKMLNVSERGIQRAAAVQRTGAPELVAAVDSGEVSVSAAAEVATLPQDEQREVVAAGQVQAKAKKIRAAKRPHVANNSGETEWYTPSYIVERARETMGTIDYDPASTEKANEIIKAETFFTTEDDGLGQEWRGNVWMNPPYAQPAITQFSDALVSKFTSNEIEQACVLVNNATETGWFQRMLQTCDAVCFLKSRVKFLDVKGNPTGAPLQGQAVLYFGGNADVFFNRFKDLGVVLYG